MLRIPLQAVGLEQALLHRTCTSGCSCNSNGGHRKAQCYSLAPPPCLSLRLALHKRNFNDVKLWISNGRLCGNAVRLLVPFSRALIQIWKRCLAGHRLPQVERLPRGFECSALACSTETRSCAARLVEHEPGLAPLPVPRSKTRIPMHKLPRSFWQNIKESTIAFCKPLNIRFG